MNGHLVVDLNVGGILYTTTRETLSKDPNSLLHALVSGSPEEIPKDNKGRVFIDRDGQIFRFVLDFLRNSRLVLPANFQEWESLRTEAEYFQLQELLQKLPDSPVYIQPSTAELSTSPKKLTSSPRCLTPRQNRPSATDMTGSAGGQGYIVVGYRGTFAFGRDMSDVKFRKLNRILVHGKVGLCKEVFKDTLNDSRDPDRGLSGDRYTARYFLKHTVLEMAFDQLSEAGFRMVGACGTGTSAPASAQDLKPGQVSIEEQWNHYNEFVFVREDRNDLDNGSCLQIDRRDSFY